MKALSLITAGFGGTDRRRPPYFATKKLALIGSTASVQYAPWFDPAWTIAAHPCARKHCKREPDWYFDMHRPECFRTESKSWNPKYYTWLKNLQTPIFMQENWEDIPMAVKYPLERILGEFRPYFTNHVAYMIALAMTEGVTHIGMFGCQYSHETEHGIQRGSAEYWLGRFEQYGGRVVLPSKFNNLLARPRGLYGYESHDKQGKLTPEYRPNKPPSISEMSPSGGMKVATLKVVDERLPESARPPLMQLPEGIAPDWERRAELLRAQ